MSEKQLNDLPEEILLQVFDKMDFKTLMESSLVCKNWNEMIGQNQIIMKKIKLVVTDKDLQMLPEQFRRSFRSIKIFRKFKNEFKWKLLEQQASNLRDLEIADSVFKKKEMENFTKLLESMTKLEALRIRGSEFDIDFSHYSHLKSLDLHYKIKILKFPETSQLTSLTIGGLKDCDLFQLMSFLSGQKCVEDLAIYNYKNELNNIEYETLKAIQFPLKKLSIRGCKWLGSEENFLLFMGNFVNTLEELDIEWGFSASMFKMIFNNFRKLNTLKVNLYDVYQVESFYFNVKTNMSIRKLTIVNCNSDLTVNKCLINKLPNIQSLDLMMSDVSKELMMLIANNLKMLKDLQISGISHQIFDGVNIPNLKRISICSVEYTNPQDWKLLVTALPNIEEFEIEGFRYMVNQIIFSAGWPKLKHVKFGNGFIAKKVILDLFLSKCKDLQTLEICETAFESDSEKTEILREVKRDGFRFIINKFELES